MLSRAISLAAVTLLIGNLATSAAHAQNLEAGKSPSQIFSGTCSACHKSPRGLLRTIGPSSLPGFLRQHYTTSGDMASVLASYLVANGAAEPQHQARQGRDARHEARPAAPPPDTGRRLFPWFSSEPDPQQQAEGGRAGRQAKQRPPRPGEAPDATAPGQPGAKSKLGKRGKPAEEPKPDASKEDAPKSESAKSEPAKPESAKSEPSRGDAGKSEADQSAAESKPAAASVAPKETGSAEPSAPRPDPVPQVTPAAPAASPPAASASPPESSPSR